MTPQQYQEAWLANGDELAPIDDHRIAKFKLLPSTAAYLNIGLPLSVAPYLSFAINSDDRFKGLALLSEQYDDLEEEYSKYVVIGADGSGNPVAVNTAKSDLIEWLDHEEYFAPSYLNSSIEALVGFLLIYRDFVDTVISQQGEHAMLDANFTDEQLEHMRQQMSAMDDKALTTEGFWKEELSMLLDNRAYYRANP